MVVVFHRSRISHDNVCAAEYHTCTTSLSRSLAAGCLRVVPVSAALLACAVPPPSACAKRDSHNSCTASTHARHTRDSGKSCMTWRAAHCTYRSRISTWRHSSTHLEVLSALYPGLQCLLVTRIFPDVCLAFWDRVIRKLGSAGATCL
jgi:hypothetical protein